MTFYGSRGRGGRQARASSVRIWRWSGMLRKLVRRDGSVI
jgi:hypothetical protein